jgi:tRNA pseudouridine55 synthase
MLPICFGAATRLSGYLLDSHKVYRVTAILGIATATGDAEGQVIKQVEGPVPELGQVIAALQRFQGPIQQVPPMYSALKRGGVPLYRLARSGIEVPREPRSVVIAAIDLEGYQWPQLRFMVRCSKGTYVRTLVEDVAAVLGTVGHVGELRRLAVEPFQEKEMTTLEALQSLADDGGSAALDRVLLPADRALDGWATVRVASDAAARLAHGQAVSADAAWPTGPVKVYVEPNEFLAVAEVTADRWLVPRRVFLR